ncbi:hypothetical protein WA026_004118 [Henosepilachna vigintioctopunctata]|uniref:MORN repeat-containing protein 5 n=1 Tax=Henosepilachna vigintioctopunctata TaxID=420089 RepID=A0AAW1UGI5_9CUCU
MALYSQSAELNDVPYVDKSKILIRRIGDVFDSKSNDMDFDDLDFNEYHFVTGSVYEGQCSKIGMEGHGIYTFPHGVVYEGQFKDGMFHGKGILVYPQGQALNCTFKKGKITKWEFLFAPPSSEDDVVPGQGRRMSTGSEDLVRLKTELDIDIATYCKPPDRRFNRSYSEGMKGAPYENRTARLRERLIPEGCYDMEDGFYNPKTKWVHSADDMEHILYMAPENPQDIKLDSESDFVKFINDIPDVPVYHTESWIKENCRKAWDENVGYKPELYEYWFSGRESERRRLNMRSREEGGKFITEESCCVKCLKRLEKMSKNYQSI